MTDYWLAAALGAGGGGLLLALFARLPAKALAMQGFIALVAMMWIYVGVRLTAGSLTEIIYETVFALIILGLAQFAMAKWPPAIGIAILFHGAYDAVIGPHTGVADWYPPLCAGFDFIVGGGLLIMLLRMQSSPEKTG